MHPSNLFQMSVLEKERPCWEVVIVLIDCKKRCFNFFAPVNQINHFSSVTGRSCLQDQKGTSGVDHGKIFQVPKHLFHKSFPKRFIPQNRGSRVGSPLPSQSRALAAFSDSLGSLFQHLTTNDKIFYVNLSD